MIDLFGHELLKTAEISPCGLYRYSLERVWWPDVMRALFIMLNPSTADADADDPTIRRCMGFAKSWGLGGIEVRNLFAYRVTDPTELHHVDDPVGPDNSVLPTSPARCVVAAWGAAACHPLVKTRALEVLAELERHRLPVLCLGTTRMGYPKHPLYVPGNTMQRPYLPC